MIKIVTDSSCDITQKQAEALGVTVMPLTINFEDGVFRDGIDIMPEEFYKKLTSSAKVPTTSQATPHDYEKVFEAARKNGDTVILLPISRCISGSHDSVVLAKKQGGFDNVYIADTLATVGFLKQMVLEAVRLKDTMPPQQLVLYLEKFRARVKLYAMIETLEYLYKGGRVSRTSAAVGSLLNIKPIISVIGGEVKVVGKGVGVKKGLSIVADYFTKADVDFTYPVLFGYAGENDRCISLIEYCTKEPAERQKYIEQMQNISPIVGVHTGPNVAVVVYVEKEK